MIPESYAEVYYKYVNYSSHARQPLSRVNVTGLLHRLQVNIQVFKIIK